MKAGNQHFRLAAIGGSAGSVDALMQIIPVLPADLPMPVVAVVHMARDSKSLLPEILGSKSRLRVVEAEDKVVMQPGHVYVAPPGYHLLAENDGSLSLSSEEEVLFSRPSIDVFFESAADAYGPDLIGVVLTGGNEDGAKGLRAILDAGGKGLIQDPETAYATAMPLAALVSCPDARVLDLGQIGVTLSEASPCH